jgi:hypothetical protein
MNSAGQDRRAELRTPADGTVELSFADPLPVSVSGRLLDTSKGGFRAAHACQEIHPGMDVRFAHHAAAGRALVVWNRIAGDAIESGFVISKARPQPKGATEHAPKTAGRHIR